MGNLTQARCTIIVSPLFSELRLTYDLEWLTSSGMWPAPQPALVIDVQYAPCSWRTPLDALAQ